MKKLFFIICFFLNFHSIAQKYFTKTGITEMKASVQAFEPIEAINNSTTTIIDTKNGTIASLLFVKAFHFKIALMQEHFNENYMDSDEFPKATFKGNLEDFDLSKLSNTETTFTLKGTLNVRGIDKEIKTTANLKKIDETIILTTEFSVKPQDFDIKIPAIVRKKIADSIILTINHELIEKK